MEPRFSILEKCRVSAESENDIHCSYFTDNFFYCLGYAVVV